MDTPLGDPDPTLYIERLTNDDAFRREAAAWSLGEIGNRRAARPLAGLLLREMKSVERSGYIAHSEVVLATVEAIRRIGAPEALYSLMKSLCVLVHSQGVDRETVEEIVESTAEVGGLNAVREAVDRVVTCARECHPICPGLNIVASVLLTRLGLCGDQAVKTLRRLANTGPSPLQPIAQQALYAL
jgi:hypothetical protein